MHWLNYHHLLYFWTVAREGSIAKACDKLHLAQPTISSQLGKLEQQMGGKLFERAGRSLRLTELGKTVYEYADEIFTLGQELTDAVRGQRAGQPLRLAVGISDVLAKLLAYRLLVPALRLTESVRVVARAGKFEDLLTELVSFDLDIVLSDAPITSSSRIKAFNHLLGECGVTFFGSQELAARYAEGFPASLTDAPLLLPPASSVARRAIDQWLDEQGLRPCIVGEFHDSALMKVFGQEGLGLFPAPSAIEEGVCRQYAVQPIGRIPEIRERFYAISVDRRLRHPAVIKISQAAKTQVFAEQKPKSD